jgi:UDP-N-acetylmuramoyl-tripeptide--D-alanyl-D-alanine ligase
MLTLADVGEALHGQRHEAWQTFKISAFCVDSRLCVPDSLFVALRGAQVDGHSFVADALSRGAQYVIAEPRVREPAGGQETATYIDIHEPLPEFLPIRPVILIAPNSLAALQQLAAWWRRKFSMRVVGVTGSVGKTITKETIAAVLSERYQVYKSAGNLNSETGLPLALLALEGKPERAVFEMAMYDIGEIAKLAEIARPQIGVVTNVGPSHLERLGTIERIAEAKAELPLALPADGWAILNGDDPYVRAMQSQTNARVMLYGLEQSNHLWASEVEGMGLQGTRFWLHYAGEQPLHVTIPLLGRHSVHTALAAAAVGLADGLAWEEIIRGLRNVSGQLRLAAVSGLNDSTLIDDTYNASPLSSLAALTLLSELEGRKLCVFADMLELGSYEREGHELVGRRAADICDLLVTVGPRARIIGESAQDTGLAANQVHYCADKAECIALLHPMLRPGDLVLIKGSRGMAMEDVVTALSVHRHG